VAEEARAETVLRAAHAEVVAASAAGTVPRAVVELRVVEEEPRAVPQAVVEPHTAEEEPHMVSQAVGAHVAKVMELRAARAVLRSEVASAARAMPRAVEASVEQVEEV